MPTAGLGSGSVTSAAITPAKTAKYVQACCATPPGGGSAARTSVIATGIAARHQWNDGPVAGLGVARVAELWLMRSPPLMRTFLGSKPAITSFKVMVTAWHQWQLHYTRTGRTRACCLPLRRTTATR